MKELQKVQWSRANMNRQLKAFKSLLDHRPALGERELLRFFNQNRELLPGCATPVWVML